MNRLPTYCELSFLDHFFGQRLTFSTAEDEYIEKWTLLHKVIQSRCTLFIDNLNEFLEKAVVNPNYTKLRKSSLTGGSEIKTYDRTTVSSLNKPLALLLNGADTDTDYCHIHCNTENWINKVDTLTFQSLYIVSKREDCNFKDWNELSKNNRTPVTGIIIADPYIMKDAVSIKNLVEIIHAILPESGIKKQVDISIFVNKDDDIPKLKKNFESVIKSLQGKNRVYDVNLSIHQISPQQLHDRNVLTNYTWVHSGHSFNFYDQYGNITKETTLDVKTIACIDNNPHISLIRNFANLAKNGKQGFDMLGNGKNNLYDI